MKAVLVVISLSCLLTYVQPRRWYVTKSQSGTCSYGTYRPGGGKVTIHTITAPTARLQTTSMKAIFTHSRTGILNGVTGVSTEVVNAIGTISKKVLKVAEKLGPALGILTGVVGLLIGDSTPTADDILEATNTAIEELTEEVNDRLEEMKAYVDSKIIDLEKDIVSRRYKFHFTYWAECIRGVSKAEVNRCQEEAYRLISASLGEFALFYDKIDSEGNFENLDEHDVKRIEVNLISFRNYVQLAFMVLNIVAESYKLDTSTIGQETYHLYEQELTRKAIFYEKYATAAVKAIVKLNTNIKTKCDDTFECDDHTITRVGGDWGPGSGPRTAPVLGYVETSCSCVLSPLFLIDQCTATVKVAPHNQYFKWGAEEYPTSTATDVGPLAAKRYLKNTANGAVKRDIDRKVKAYWNSEVSIVVACAKALSEGGNCE